MRSLSVSQACLHRSCATCGCEPITEACGRGGHRGWVDECGGAVGKLKLPLLGRPGRSEFSADRIRVSRLVYAIGTVAGKPFRPGRAASGGLSCRYPESR